MPTDIATQDRAADGFENSGDREPRPVAVVLNGAAGALLGQGDAATTLETLFAEAGFAPTFIPPDAGTLPERIEAAHRLGFGSVIVGGGDGTIACAAQALAGTGITLGILPFGTMNLLATDLGIEPAKPQVALGIIAQGHVREIDVAEVNGRVFLCASMLGVPVQLGRVREQQRHGSAVRLWGRFARAAVRAMSRQRKLRADLVLDGVTEHVRTPSLTITVNPIDDAAGRRFARPVLDGGQLSVYVFGDLGFGTVLRLAARMVLGRWRRDGAVREQQARTVLIATRRDALHVMNDGEIMVMQPPLKYTIRPRALRVFAPRLVAGPDATA